MLHLSAPISGPEARRAGLPLAVSAGSIEYLPESRKHYSYIGDWIFAAEWTCIMGKCSLFP